MYNVINTVSKRLAKNAVTRQVLVFSSLEDAESAAFTMNRYAAVDGKARLYKFQAVAA